MKLVGGLSRWANRLAGPAQAPVVEGGQPSSANGEADLQRAAAKVAHDGADFDEAFRRWHLSARKDPNVHSRADSIMRAGRARQMSDDWRAEAGHWEWLGNTLGRAADEGTASTAVLENRYGTDRGREGFAQFYVISDVEWNEPLHDAMYRTEAALTRHRQAAAYQWAGERAAAAAQHDEAARLYRRAGIGWERSEHPNRYERAAACYYRAALSAAQSLRFQTRRRLFDGWCPSCLRDKKREDHCGAGDDKHEEPLDEHFSNLGDLDRLIVCWRKALLAAPSPNEDRAAARMRREAHFREAQRQLGIVQHTLAAGGARNEAVRTYRSRMDFRRRYLRATRSWRWPSAVVHWLTSCYGSRLRQFLLVLVVLYAVVCPILWAVSGRVALSRPGGGSQATASWTECLTFSLGNAINASSDHFAPGDTLTTFLQIMQAITAYFALGYALWIAQRSYAS